jgi:hypothetical protein
VAEWLADDYFYRPDHDKVFLRPAAPDDVTRPRVNIKGRW